MENDAVIDNEVIEEPTEEIEADAIKPEEEPQDPPAPSPDEKDAVQKRIDKATRKQRDAERDRDYWRTQAQKPVEVEKPAPKPEPIEVKTLEDFDFDENKYQAYIFDQAAKHATVAAKSAIEEDKSNTDTQTRQKAFQSKEGDYSKTVTDYMEVTRDESLSLTKEMVDIASTSDDGPALLYYLAKNPDISEAISRLSPMDAAREMGRIEATKLSVSPKTKTKAPPPAKKIDGGDPKISKTPEEMSQKEFNAYRRKVIAKRGN